VFDFDIQVNLVSKYNSVVTVEDHLKDGGMGSWMLEALSDYPNQIIKIRIDALSQSIFGMVGQQSVLNEMGGLTRERLCK
jgi:transketolase